MPLVKMVKKEKEPQSYKPKVGDRIICEHKGYKYEAKILSSRKNPDSLDKNPEMQFFVHYQGWNKNWDEWVDEARVHQYNETNVASMKDQRVQSKAKGINSARKAKLTSQQSQANISTISSQGSVSDSIVVEPEEPVHPEKEVKIKIPDELKNWLIDDDNNVKNKKLTILPAKTTISTILKDFVTYKKNSTKTPGDKEVIFNELTLGIRDYFNVMLGAHLLYKFERLQYQLLLKDHGKDIDLTNQYGVIHLVRLFTKIGRPLAATTLDPQNVQTIVNYIQDLLKFISKQANLFDLDKNYTIAPPEYIKSALK